MPSNFYTPVENTQTPDVTVVQGSNQPPSVASIIDMGSRSIAQLGRIVAEKRDESAYIDTANQLDEASKSIEPYYQQRNALYKAMLTADDKNLADIQKQLEKLKTGGDQGVYTPSEVQLRMDKIVKDATVRLPHLAPQFRALSNEASGNIAAVAREYGGEDPIDKATRDVLEEATKTGMAPAAIVSANRAKTVDGAIKTQLEIAAATGDLEKDNIVSFGTARAATVISQSIPELSAYIRDQLKTGKVTNEGVDAIVAAFLMNKTQALMGDLFNTAAKAGVALSTSEQDAILKPARDQLENLKVLMKATDTVDAKLKYLQSMASQVDAQGRLEPLTNDAYLAGILGQLPNEEARKAYLGTLYGFVPKWARLVKSGLSDERKDEIINSMEASFQGPNAGYMAKAVEDVRRGLYDNELGRKTTAMLMGQDTSAIPTPPVVDAAAVSISKATYEDPSVPADMRKTWTPGMVKNLPVADVYKMPTLVNDLKKDPTQLDVFLGKVATDMAPFIGPANGPDAIVYTGNATNPFQWKDFSAHALGSPAPLLKLNQRFAALYKAFGPEIADQFVDTISAMGVERAQGAGKVTRLDKPATNQYGYTEGTPLETVTVAASRNGPNLDEIVNTAKPGVEVPAEASSGLVALTHSVADQMGVPKDLVDALLHVESTGGKFLANNASKAKGPLQITPSTFASVNASQFDGKLSWTKAADVVKASLAHIKDLIGKYEDPEVAFAAYYLGEPKVNSALLKGGKDAIFDIPVPGQKAGDNVTLREYLARAFGE